MIWGFSKLFGEEGGLFGGSLVNGRLLRVGVSPSLPCGSSLPSRTRSWKVLLTITLLCPAQPRFPASCSSCLPTAAARRPTGHLPPAPRAGPLGRLAPAARPSGTGSQESSPRAVPTPTCRALRT